MDPLTRIDHVWFKPESLIHLTDLATWQRSVKIFQNKMVRHLEIQHDNHGWALSGSVQGTQRQPYQIRSRIALSDEGQILSWNSHCTCPVQQDCKHGVALLILAAFQARPHVGPGTVEQKTPAHLAAQAAIDKQEALDRQALAETRLAEDQLLTWLERMERANDQAAEITHGPRASAPASQHVQPKQYLYLLSLSRHQRSGAQLKIEVVTSYRKKNGDWAKTQSVRNLPASDFSADNHIAPEELDILRLISAMPGGANMYAYPASLSGIPQGQLGAMALALAASTERLFMSEGLSTPDIALQWGPPLALSWNWQETLPTTGTDSSWILHAALAQPDATLCLNQPPLYLDLRAGLCGPVISEGLSALQIEVLVKAPPFKASMLKKHQHTLLEMLCDIPLPSALPQMERIKNILPKPCLHLQYAPSELTDKHSTIQALLTFDYQGHREWWGERPETVTIDLKDSRCLLHRNLRAELEAIAHLHDLGLFVDEIGLCTLDESYSDVLWALWSDNHFANFTEAGFQVTFDPALKNLVHHTDNLLVEMQPEDTGAESSSPWFDLSLGIEFDGRRHNILPWIPTIIDQVNAAPRDQTTDLPILPPFIYLPNTAQGGFLRTPTTTLAPWLAVLLEFASDRREEFDAEHLKLTRLEALRTGASLGAGITWQGAQILHDIAQQLSGAQQITEVAVPDSVRASLRPYQQMGLNWMQFLGKHGLGGILADDMGLGKTLQTLVHIQIEKDNERLTHPALIIVPVSLLGNWEREAARFCPHLRTLVIHGKDRHSTATDLSDLDLVIAPYSLLQRDRERWLGSAWHIVVLDEAQNIKNASTLAAQVVREIKANQRLCLSGTPIENHLGELWSLYHFLMPGFLGSQKRFGELFRTPIEKHNNLERLKQLRTRITPFMLRRTKDQVATELPPKIETTMRVELSGKQADLYETIRLTTEKTVREALSNKGLAKSHITILDALLKLRQVCCDPRLISTAAAKKIQQSAKLDHLMEILPEMLAEGRRILLFSQFTSMLKLIEAELLKRTITYVKLTGASQNRDTLIEQFTSGRVPLFLISLKAGGVGLNLPQADTVIHFDPWWNPAAENQATDRAHRIGQTQNVWVIKLVAQGTIEERILAMQERKASLAQSMYSESAARTQPKFTETDLAELLKPLGE